jgi:hypothetical protein
MKSQEKKKILRISILSIGAVLGILLTVILNNILSKDQSSEFLAVFISIFSGLLTFWLSICVVVIFEGYSGV